MCIKNKIKKIIPIEATLFYFFTLYILLLLVFNYLKIKKNKTLMKHFFKTMLFVSALFVSVLGIAQTPAYGVTGFNNDAFDQFPFATGTAYPSVMTATNVAGTGWSFHIGAIGAYVITQVDKATGGAYDGAITATNVTPNGFPKLYQTFAFTSTNLSMFKLNSVKVKISNASGLPVPMILAGVISGANTGSTQNFVAMPGSNWVTITTSSDPNFSNINGVIVINATGSASVAEMSFDDINISAPNPLAIPPVITVQPTDKTVCSNKSTTFTGTATGAAGYFWLMSTDGLIWNPITSSNASTTFSGYNTNSLTVNNASVGLNGLYLGMTAVSSLGVNKGSNAVRLYVNAAPTVPAISGSNQVCVGSSINLSNSVNGGAWSSYAVGRATVNSAGQVSGNSVGSTDITYTVTSGGCSTSVTKSISVMPLPQVPSIGYAPGTVNPQAGAPSGSYCVGKVFSVEGSPIGGTWSSSGIVGVTGLGVVTINAVGAGTLTYTYTNGSGCSNSRTINGNGFTCSARSMNASSESTVENNDFAIFPNPAKNKINISQEFVTANAQITVTNVYGKNVKVQTLSMGNNSLDISNLAKGIYLLNINNNGKSVTKKFVVE